MSGRDLPQNSLGYEEADADAVAALALEADGDPVRDYLKRAAMGDLTAQELGCELLGLMENKHEIFLDSRRDEYVEREGA